MNPGAIDVNIENTMEYLAQPELNLYDIAFYTSQGIRYHRFQPCNRCNDSYSVAKAFVMTAVGLLWDDGLLSMTDPLEKFFGRYLPSGADPGWRVATVEHALTHRLGFAEGFLDIDVEDVSAYPTEDYLSMVLSHPLSYEPGTHAQYSDAAFYLLSRLVSLVAGENVDTLLRRRILSPMQVGEAAWSRCPKGYPIGATGLYIGTADMVKLGALYLNGGVYQGRRLLSEDWVNQVLAREYEFRAMTAGGLIGKGGMYGQMLAFSREKGFAVAIHAYKEHKGGEELLKCLNEVTL